MNKEGSVPVGHDEEGSVVYERVGYRPDVEVELEKLKPEDGDFIFVNFTEHLSPEMRQRFMEGLSNFMKTRGIKAVAIGCDVGISVGLIKGHVLHDIYDRLDKLEGKK